jgi:hypothetical protein
MLKFINLYDHAKARIVDYEKVFNLSKTILKKSKSDLSVIIPAYGREGFLEPLVESFKKASSKSPVSVVFTVVEHSEIPLHIRTAERLGINHIWIPKEESESFNKCLAMNVGAASVSATEYLFHDLDCLVQSSFFNNLYENINKKKCKAIQAFSDRRVLYLNKELTYKALLFGLDIENLIEGPRDMEDENYTGVTPPGVLGAPGGSIWIKKEKFIEVGGYDPNVFYGYSPEDIFFWDKVSFVTKMETCTNPRVEIFHMHHPPTHASNPQIRHLIELHKAFVNCNDEDKLKFLSLQRSNLLEAYGRFV